MKRFVGALGLLLALYFGAQAALRALRTDEEVVRDLLRAEQAAFDDGSIVSTMRHFAADWRDASGLTRDQLHAGVVYAMQNRHGPDGSFRYAVAFQPDDVEVAVDGDAAKAVFDLELVDESAPRAANWRVRVEVEFARRDGEWWIARSKHATTGGKRPF